jgi:predicted aconitase with swiveling domain
VSADERLVLRGPAGYGEAIEAEALVSSDGFSARYDLDHTTGVISREAHELYGQSLVGKVLVVSTAKGGTATGWRMHRLVPDPVEAIASGDWLRLRPADGEIDVERRA